MINYPARKNDQDVKERELKVFPFKMSEEEDVAVVAVEEAAEVAPADSPFSSRGSSDAQVPIP